MPNDILPLKNTKPIPVINENTENLDNAGNNKVPPSGKKVVPLLQRALKPINADQSQTGGSLRKHNIPLPVGKKNKLV